MFDVTVSRHKPVFWYCLLGLLTLNLEAVRCSETSKTVYQSTQYLFLYQHRCKSLRSGRARSLSPELCAGLGTGGSGRATVRHALPSSSVDERPLPVSLTNVTTSR
jgi:hypothetical protein